MRKKVFLAGVGLLAALSLTACTTGKQETAGAKENTAKTVNLMEQNEIASMDTLITQDMASINAQVSVFEGLYSINDKNEIVPAIAADMPEISEDGKTYRIKLRDDAVWSNGDSVTAHDFVFAWRRLATPENQANYFFLMDGTVENGSQIINEGMDPEKLGVKAVNDYELEVKLEKATPYFTSLLTFSPFYPQNEKFVTETGKEYGSTSDKILSNGAFMIKNWDQNSQEWDLVKNPDYYDADKVKLKKVHFNVIKEAVTAYNLFEDDQLDSAEIFGEYVKQNKDNPLLHTIPGSTVYYFKMNQKINDKESIFANQNVRKAVAYSLDKEGLIENVLADGSTASYGFIPKNFVANPETDQDFRKEAGDLGKTDKKKALTYWNEAQKEIGETIKIEMLISDTDAEKKVAEFIQWQLQEALPGLTVEIKAVPLNNSIQLTRNSEYELAIGRWGPDYQDPTTYLNNLRSPNNTNYESAQYNDLMNKINTDYANDLDKRWQTMIEVEKLLVEEDAAIVPLYQQAHAILTKEELQGIYYPSFGASTIIKYAEYKE